jgi:hypothetical protein
MGGRHVYARERTYGRRDETRPVSTGGETRRVQSVREGGGGGARERTIANAHWMPDGYSDAVASGRGISSAHKPPRAARRGQPAPASSADEPGLSRGVAVGGRAGTWKEHPQALLLRCPAVRKLLVPEHLQVVLPCRACGSEAGARASAAAGAQESPVAWRQQSTKRVAAVRGRPCAGTAAA